jgi:hypothetical protein
MTLVGMFISAGEGGLRLLVALQDVLVCCFAAAAAAAAVAAAAAAAAAGVRCAATAVMS